MYDKSQDNFSTALSTVVGVQWKEKKTGYRSVVVSTRRRGAARIAESKKKKHLKLSRSTLYSHATPSYKSHGRQTDCHKELPIAPGVPLLHFFAL
jgi:hypothetical protein